MNMPSVDSTPPWLRRYTKLVAASTLFLVFAGAMVTSTGSGLAVPDWPLAYGMVFPPMVGGIFYEHGHRLVAATVGLLTVIQAIWIQRREPKRSLRLLAWAAVGAVIAQGLLGGLTVLLLLPPSISIGHAGLAEIFLAINVSIAFFASRWFISLRNHEKGSAPVRSSALLVLLIYAQILIGATMRHLGAGLAIPDFPLSFGRIVPPFTTLAVAVNFAHRVGGFTVAAAIVIMALSLFRYDREHPLRVVAAFLVVMVAAQVLLGGYTVWSGKQPLITSLHVVTGALTLATAVVFALTARTLSWRTRREEPQLTGHEVAA